jgi:peptidoglycan/xylan/chitin deacetylase (PgdA/CDA1 family)
MWPEGKQSAAVLTFDFDAEEVWISALGPDAADRPGVLSQGRYGAKVGVPMILELLQSRGLPATFFVPGRVCERHPQVVASIVEAGHEVALHGYTHTDPSRQTINQEREELEKSLTLFNGFGVTPKGYRSPAWEMSPSTLGLLSELGVEYSSNFMDDIRPYVHAGSEVVELPVQWLLDDAPHFMFAIPYWNKTIVPPQLVLDSWKAEFAGIHRAGGSFVLTMHPQFIGRPSRLTMLEQLLEIIQSHDDVWIAKACDVARLAKQSLDAERALNDGD